MKILIITSKGDYPFDHVKKFDATSVDMSSEVVFDIVTEAGNEVRFSIWGTYDLEISDEN